MYIDSVTEKNIPQLTLPTDEFDEMKHMSAAHLVSLLRTAVLSPERAGHFRPVPPAEHDAYRVSITSARIDIRLFSAGRMVFRVSFVRAEF